MTSAGKPAPFLVWWARVPPHWKQSLAVAAGVWLASRALVLLAAIVAPLVLPERVYPDLIGMVPFHTSAPRLFDMFVRWDGFHFLAVASDGYHVADIPWLTNTHALPLYPLLMAAFGGWAGETGLVVAGILLSNATFLAGLTVLHRLVDLDFGPDVAQRTLLYLAVFPSSLFFSAVYAESLFLLLCAGMFLALRGRRWWAAGIFVALTAATRVPGMALPAVFVWEAMRAHGWQPLRAWRAALPLSLTGLTVAAVCAVMWVQVGDPLSFITSHALWGRRPGTPLDQFLLICAILSQPGARPSLNLIYLLVLVIGFGVAGVRLLVAGRPSYALWFWLSFFMALSSPTAEPLYSVPRLLLGGFPAFIVFAEAGRSRLFHFVYLAFCVSFLLIATALFVQWYWVS